METSSPVWSAQLLLWNKWAEEFLVYNVASGSTHIVSPAAAEILQYLEKCPRTVSQLVSSISSESGVESDQEIVGHVERIIGDLDELGLIRALSE